ncbi:MAG: hypothetical protein DIU84_06750, partial [Bacillota bacterium]
MRSIQAKIVLIFSVLIVITMQFIAAFLLRSLEDYFITEQERRLTYEARVLSGELASLMAGPVDDGGSGAGPDAVQALIDQRSLPGPVMVADPSGTVT